MLKIRSLHPDFFTDAKIGSLSFGARLLFTGLWCHSDDYGRGRYLEKSIEGDVFPRDEVNIGELLDELLDLDLIRLYTVPGQFGQDRFYFIPNWEKYQSPKYRANTSIPEPPNPETPGHMEPGQSGQDSPQSSLELVRGEGVGEGEVEGVEDFAPAALNGLKQTLVALFGEPPKANWSMYNRIATFIRDHGGTADEVRYKASRIAEEWGVKAVTPTSLEKYWTRYDAEVGQLTEADLTKHLDDKRRAERRARAETLDRGLPHDTS